MSLLGQQDAMASPPFISCAIYIKAAVRRRTVAALNIILVIWLIFMLPSYRNKR
nr:MAG TPA: hypothetical protein [Caudoviricetes sp.]